MTNDTTDLLQIKIDEAKAQLPEETRNAINAVDYKAVILEMRKTKGYTFEQLGDLETETELLLCGLVSPEDYSKEIGNRLHLVKTEVNELVKEMNDRVFSKIKENLVKDLEGKEKETDTQILNSAGIEILPPLDKGRTEEGSLDSDPLPTSPLLRGRSETPPILTQKLSGYVKNDIVTTEHSLENITRATPSTPPSTPASKPSIDPYREIPE
jgi:hypothetical protein